MNFWHITKRYYKGSSIPTFVVNSYNIKGIIENIFSKDYYYPSFKTRIKCFIYFMKRTRLTKHSARRLANRLNRQIKNLIFY